MLDTTEAVQAYLSSPSSFLHHKYIGITGITVETVSGGRANHTYRVHITSENQDVPKSIILKYSPGFVAMNPTYALTNMRGFFEYSAIAEVPVLPTTNPDLVSPPKSIHYDAEGHLLAIEDAGPTTRTLKDYLISNDSTFDAGVIGRGLGEWLAELHLWGQTDTAAKLRSVLSQNLEMAAVGLNYTFAALSPPDDPLWKDIQAYLEAVKRTDDNTGPFVVHGDFWTGNIILAPTSAGELRIKVLDWEASNCRNTFWNDLGQMCSEMYQPAVFGHITEEKGREIISSFLSAYKERRTPTQEEVRMAVVRCGVHMVVWPGLAGWGDEASVEACRALGREYAEKGWNRDWNWVRECVLGVLVSDSW
ncbi:kinase-like domain-containing protein [Coprinopsis sp. MPI-PUGE-AT-0042]|nr:kinase-like domain-containing protein [Coprinopsis sp. MPI-PUGE-AT-0042]